MEKMLATLFVAIIIFSTAYCRPLLQSTDLIGQDSNDDEVYERAPDEREFQPLVFGRQSLAKRAVKVVADIRNETKSTGRLRKRACGGDISLPAMAFEIYKRKKKQAKQKKKRAKARRHRKRNRRPSKRIRKQRRRKNHRRMNHKRRKHRRHRKKHHRGRPHRRHRKRQKTHRKKGRRSRRGKRNLEKINWTWT